MIFKALWGIIKSLSGIVKWFFKRPIKCGKVVKPFDEWEIIGGRDVLYKEELSREVGLSVLMWRSAKLPLKVRRFIFRSGMKNSPILALRRVGYDSEGQTVIELSHLKTGRAFLGGYQPNDKGLDKNDPPMGGSGVPEK